MVIPIQSHTAVDQILEKDQLMHRGSKLHFKTLGEGEEEALENAKV